MNQISLLDKIKVIFDLTKSNIIYPVVIFLLIIISFLFMTTNKNNKKESKRVYRTIYLIIIVITLIKYSTSFLEMFDYMMNNLFIVFYFPNIAVYLGAVIATNIIMWISMFSTRTKQFIKTINSIIFSIIHYIFILLLGVITKEKINVFQYTDLYQNESVHSLIELTSNIFLIWILFLVVYKVIITYVESNKLKENIYNKGVSVEHVHSSNNVRGGLVLNLPDSVNKIEPPYIVKRDMGNAKIVYNIPQQQENTAIYEQMLTLEDYKLLISLLREEKTADIKKIIESQNKKVLEKNADSIIESKTENSLSELMALYKSV